MAAGHQGAPEEGVGGRGEAEEGGRLPRVEVELCQTEGGEGGHEQCHEGQGGAEVVGVHHLLQTGEDHTRRGYAEGDDVGQRVEFLADG